MKKLIIGLLFLGPLTLRSQSFWVNDYKSVEVGGFASTTDQNPFWLRSNQFGIIPAESPGATLRLNFASTPSPDWQVNTAPLSPVVDFPKKTKKITLNYGLQAVANVGKNNQFLLPEAYISVKWKAFEFYGGRRKEIVGLVDSTLSSGSYSWSGNALPMPKLQISLPNYAPILGKGLISIKGNYAHGWFDNGLVKNFYLHQKSLYTRVGRPNWKWKFYGGFNHQVQWGGRPAEPYVEASTGRLITHYPSDFSTYLKVVTGVSLNRDGSGLDADGVPINEALNRAGNHLGSIDLGMEWTLPTATLFVYRQSFYEDGSLYYLNNIADGLLGLAITPTKSTGFLQKITFEYLNTTSQGGNSGGGFATIGQLRGVDNYFNNGVYADGWTYNGNTIGTPFIVPKHLLSKEISEKYPRIGENFLLNNRVQAFYMGMLNKLKNTQLVSKVAFSKNLGTYYQPLDIDNISFSQQVRHPFGKTDLNVSFAFDLGELYGNQFGGYIGVLRHF